MSKSTAIKEIVLITGAPGVGKTEVARRLISGLPQQAALIDTDAVGAIHPFEISDDFYRVASRNLGALAESYNDWGAQTLLISGVTAPQGLLQPIREIARRYNARLKLFVLQASEQTLAYRIQNDAKFQDVENRLSWFHLNQSLSELPGATLIDTESIDIDTVVSRIHEAYDRSDDAEQNKAEPQTHTTVGLSDALTAVEQAIGKLGLPAPLPREMAQRLIDAESDGHPSHGIQRLLQLAREIDDQTVNSDALPTLDKRSATCFTIEGNRAPGIRCAIAVQDCLIDNLKSQNAVFVCLHRSGHLGRLGDIARAVAKQGHVVMGFVNYLGRGLNTPPANGSTPAFCTNPILLGMPADPDQPLIIDMSTTSVSEGTIRIHSRRSQPVPTGWLIDKHAKPVHDPDALYHKPRQAMLAPLGGGESHKGYALALGVEALVGALAAGEHNASPGPADGNGGLFIGIRADLFSNQADYLSRMQSILGFVRSIPPADPRNPVRTPGQSRAAPDLLHIDAELWDAVKSLAQGQNPQNLKLGSVRFSSIHIKR